MHTEDIRARLAARYFRSTLKSQYLDSLVSAETLLADAERVTGIRRSLLPGGDPLLSGAHALLDREFNTIWLSADRPPVLRHSDAAHEFGHAVMHQHNAVSSLDEDDESLAGYSKNQRDEVDAHRFAAEFLLPLDLLKSRFLAGDSLDLIADTCCVARKLALKQLITAFSSEDELLRKLSNEPAPCDSWQHDAAHSAGPCLVCGASGTGKTTTLIERCRVLIERDGSSAAEILVIAHSKRSAALLRDSLARGGNLSLHLVPVATPYQLAYDLVVRFPEAAGLDVRWEESCGGDQVTPSRLLELANELFQSIAAPRERYRHILIDDFDKFNLESLQFIAKMARNQSPVFWAAASQTNEKQSKELFTSLFEGEPSANKVQIHFLPFEYRSSTTLFNFRRLINPPDSRREISRRPFSDRCGPGSITLSVSRDFNEVAIGVADYVEKKVKSGYAPEDLVVLMSDNTTKNAANRDKLASVLNGISVARSRRTPVLDLLAIVQLCFGQFSLATIVRAATLPGYRSPIREILEYCKSREAGEDVKGRTWGRGLTKCLDDIRRCRSTGTPKDALVRYLFQVSDYLRTTVDSNPAVEYLLRHLPDDPAQLSDFCGSLRTVGRESFPSFGESIEIRILSPSRFAERHVPIVIVVGTDLARLQKLVTGKGKGELQNVPRSAESVAAESADDHLVYAYYSSDPEKAIGAAGRLSRLAPELQIESWAETSLRQVNAYKPTRIDSDGLAQDEISLHHQCPRRVYYRRILDLDTQTSRSTYIRSSDCSDRFPPIPADNALCLSCRYSEICPIELY